MKHSVFSKSLIRVPSYSIDKFMDAFGTNKSAEEIVSILLADEFFLESIYVASPELYRVIPLWKDRNLLDKKKVKFEESILKYFIRSTVRSTPFGLFAGISTLDNNEELTQLTLGELGDSRSESRLDMDSVSSIYFVLSQHEYIKPYLKYFNNSTLYRLGENYRYVEISYVGLRKKYDLTSVEFTTYLEDILKVANNGATLNSLAVHLEKYTDSFEEAKEYVDTLIESQILVSEMEMCTTGERTDLELKKILANIKGLIQNPVHYSFVQNTIDKIDFVLDQLSKIDSDTGYKRIEAVESILQNLSPYNFNLNQNSLIQTDLKRSFTQKSLGKDILDSVNEGITLLSRLSPRNRKNQELTDFIEKFKNRYESKEVPLVEALDVESGIGYANSNDSTDNIFLIDSIFKDHSQENYTIREMKWESDFHKMLTNKILNAVANGLNSIEIEERDISGFKEKNQYFHATYTAFVTLIETGETPKIVLSSVGGPTAASWLGRFCFVDGKVKELVQEISASEKNFHSHAIVAELTHLPETRLGNVLQRPSLREYEIPYLSKSSLPEERQIKISDLYLSFRNGKLLLRSKKHNKQVIPYISNALNYKAKGLPLFTFLGDLQEMNGTGGHYFDIGAVNEIFENIPRITYKNIILRKATWTIDRSYILILETLDGQALQDEWISYCKRRRLPDFFSIKEGDNELVFSSKSQVSLKLFVNLVKRKAEVLIRESLIDKMSAVRDGKGQHYGNELLLFYKNQRVENDAVLSNYRHYPVDLQNRDLIIGGECIFVKIYLGYKQADNLLIELSELLEEMVTDKIVEKWFFIRYRDPEHHLRLRIFTSLHHYNQIYRKLHEVFVVYKNNKLISEIVQDTYKREIERYGAESIDDTENLFFIDSLLTAKVIKLIYQFDGDNADELRWIAALYLASVYIKLFLQNDSELTIQFVSSTHFSFINEFQVAKKSQTYLDQAYAKYKTTIENLLEGGVCVQDDLEQIRQQIDGFSEKLKNSLLKIKNDQGSEILGSLIHMSVNRFFRSSQRLYELSIYHMLKRYYVGAVHRKKIFPTLTQK
jgi:thiopeptide-type bacteriocin biosynthesis protein